MRFPHLGAHHLWTSPVLSGLLRAAHLILSYLQQVGSDNSLCSPLTPAPSSLPAHLAVAKLTHVSKGTGPIFSTAEKLGPRHIHGACRAHSQHSWAAPAQRTHLMPEHTLPSYGHTPYSKHAGLQHLHWRCDFSMNIYKFPINLHL